MQHPLLVLYVSLTLVCISREGPAVVPYTPKHTPVPAPHLELGAGSSVSFGPWTVELSVVKGTGNHKEQQAVSIEQAVSHSPDRNSTYA